MKRLSSKKINILPHPTSVADLKNTDVDMYEDDLALNVDKMEARRQREWRHQFIA